MRKNEHNARIALAWHIEAFARVKVLPKLSTLFAQDDETPKRTPWEQQLAVAMQWHGVLTAAAKQVKR